MHIYFSQFFMLGNPQIKVLTDAIPEERLLLGARLTIIASLGGRR
jgi:hypothetical protein